MGYRDRRRERRALDKQRGAALGFALLSGHGAGLFLSVLTPIQLFGRVTPQFLGLVMLAGAAMALSFGTGAILAWNGLSSDGESEQFIAQARMKRAINYGMYNFLAVVGALVMGAFAMFSPEFRAFAFGTPNPAESVAPTSPPTSAPTAPTPERPPG